MSDPVSQGRPLDAREAAAFERIVQGLGDLEIGPEPDAEPPALAAAPPAPAPGPVALPPSRVTGRQVILVLLASAVFALFTTTLPHPLNLWAPVVVLAFVSAVAVVRGWRQ